MECPSPAGDGCPRHVVKLPDGRFRAVCGNRPAICDSIDVSAEDIANLSLNRKELEAALRQIVNARPISGGPAMIIGVHDVAAGIGIPIALAIPGPMEQASPDSLPHPESPGAILMPTPASISLQAKKQLQDEGHIVLALSEIVGLDSQQQLIGLQPVETLLGTLRNKLLATRTSAESGCIWVLPSGTRWEDLTFDFTDAEVLNVRCHNETRRYEPDQFGFKSRKNGRPTMGWLLLRRMAANAGRLPRGERKHWPTVEKHKQLLAQRLKSLFAISDDPMPWNRSECAYVARFIIRDSRPKRGRDAR